MNFFYRQFIVMAITYTTMNQNEELVHFRVEELIHTLIILLINLVRDYSVVGGELRIKKKVIDGSC